MYNLYCIRHSQGISVDSGCLKERDPNHGYTEGASRRAYTKGVFSQYDTFRASKSSHKVEREGDNRIELPASWVLPGALTTTELIPHLKSRAS